MIDYILALSWLCGRVRQAKCEHQRVFENRARRAICKRCRKDLGFIGSWREKKDKQ